ncbi:MAG: amino acid synthesis family protein [Pseudomonadota bacterium]|nr:amino acid synthesis family protein [Pseudomonadota bacterium]
MMLGLNLKLGRVEILETWSGYGNSLSMLKRFSRIWPPAETPKLQEYVAAVTHNPCAGHYVEDILPLMEQLEPMGIEMAEKLMNVLDGADQIVAYGKAAVVGENGELEHAALWHKPGGYGMRKLMEKSAAIVPSTKKVGAPGCSIDVPIAHANAAYVRSHFDTVVCSVNDAPRANEVVWVQSMATTARIYARSSGLSDGNVIGEDGLR